MQPLRLTKVAIILILSCTLSSCQTKTLVQLTGVTWYGSINNPLWSYEHIHLGFYNDSNPLSAAVTMIGTAQEVSFTTDVLGKRMGDTFYFTFDAYLDPRRDEVFSVTLEATVSATEMAGQVTTPDPNLDFDFTAKATTSTPPVSVTGLSNVK